MKNSLLIYCTIVGWFISCPAYAQKKSVSEKKDTVAATAKSKEKKAEPVSMPSEKKGDTEVSEKSSADSGEEPPGPEGDIFSKEEREYVEDPNLAVKKDKADEYFKKGTLLYEGGDFASAAQAFLVAYETLPHQAVLGNVALCYDKAGKVPEATVYYRRYLEKPVNSEKNEYMAARLKELDALVGTVAVSCPVDGCEIRVNGITRGANEAEVVVMPGEQRVEGYVDDELIDSRIVDVNNREKVAVSLVEKEKPPEPPPPLPAPMIHPLPKPEEPELSVGFWVAVSSTIVSGVMIGVFGGLALHTKSAQQDTNDPGEIDEYRKEGENYKLVTNIMVGITGAGALTSLIIGINDLKGKKKNVALTNGGTDLGIGIAVSF